MQGIKRKVVYVSFYEAIAIALTTTVFYLLGYSMTDAGVASVVASVIAVLWNLVWNTGFEFWESRQIRKGRSIARRIAHAIGFEGGLVVFLVPFFAWWLQVSWWEALVLDAGLIVFFLVYTFVFSWVFDRVFGLPASAMPQPVTQGQSAR
ncbi:PACE efflux transporter [Pusillimonas minor]|uniref:PACE efflux transporter n=1 Tax=Pusillimonas minor TaxID=2697024 RepID=A0A842HPG4_9BURK|nr:PACE efflux transporter [Pusillimonas minor]MBC2770096.1 PACE efflux transporter [Pusillimonas minor]